MQILGFVLIILLGLFLLSKGADHLVEGASTIALKLKIPEIIVGLTVVAIGTSMPELMVSVNASLAGNPGVSLGNIVGSNLANLFLVINLCAIIAPIKISRQTRFVDQPLVVAATTILFLMIQDGAISHNDGLILLICTGIYIAYTIFISIKHPQPLQEDPNEEEVDDIAFEEGLFDRTKIGMFCKGIANKVYDKSPVIYSLVGIIAGIVLLKFGGDVTVEYAEKAAELLHIPDKIIAVTIIAVGTSLPELVTCIKATKAGAADLAVGNIVGSQLFNIILVLGTASSIAEISVDESYLRDIFIILIGNIIYMLIPFMDRRHQIKKFIGVSFVSVYFLYMTFLCMVTN